MTFEELKKKWPGIVILVCPPSLIPQAKAAMAREEERMRRSVREQMGLAHAVGMEDSKTILISPRDSNSLKLLLGWDPSEELAKLNKPCEVAGVTVNELVIAMGPTGTDYTTYIEVKKPKHREPFYNAVVNKGRKRKW